VETSLESEKLQHKADKVLQVVWIKGSFI